MYTISMALADYIPVLFFGAAGFILVRDLYGKMGKGAYAIFGAGIVDVFLAGFLKALYKLLYAADLCNFEALSNLFFPLQAIGFLFSGIAMVCCVTEKKREKKLYGAAPAVFSGTAIFVSFMVLGLLGICSTLSVMAKRLHRKIAIVFFVISFLFSLTMGYLSSQDFISSSVNWIAQAVNSIGQVAFFVGVMILDKAGLAKTDKI